MKTMSRKVKIKLFAQISEVAGKKELELEGETIGDLLERLVEDIVELEEVLFKEKKARSLKEDIIILKEGRNIDHLKGLDSEIEEGDKISIFPVVGGG